MLTPPADLPISAADSARAVASVYTASLLATAPILAAIVAGIALRRATAEGRVLVWRTAAVMLLIAFAGRLLPMRLAGWPVPSFAAAPLIALGRIRVADLAVHAGDAREVFSGARWIQIGLLLYSLGTIAVLLPTAIASLRARQLLRRARRLDGDDAWAAALDDSRVPIGVPGAIGLYSSAEVAVPMTWGVRHPVILLPRSADAWTPEQRRIVLRHELSHVRAGDWTFGVVARLVCAFYWFHPGAWWIARSMRRDAERAADDRVIASGIRRSDYAELLIAASPANAWPVGAALTLATRSGGLLRARLAAILDIGHSAPPLARRWTLAATAACVVSVLPLGAVDLAPTRDVLASLMRDSRWESRAYAVLGLAHRSDTVAVARSAAELDPSPRVRAWARYALGLRPDAANAAAESR